MMIKYGFNVQTGGRVLNPTAVFCNDRDAYYMSLSGADTGTNDPRKSSLTLRCGEREAKSIHYQETGQHQTGETLTKPMPLFLCVYFGAIKCRFQDDGLESWCLYVLSGIHDERQKVDQLTKYDYLRDKLLKPALAQSKQLKN